MYECDYVTCTIAEVFHLTLRFCLRYRPGLLHDVYFYIFIVY